MLDTIYLLYIPTFMFPLFQHIVINSYIVTNIILHWFRFVISVKELNYIFYVFLFVIVSNK